MVTVLGLAKMDVKELIEICNVSVVLTGNHGSGYNRSEVTEDILHGVAVNGAHCNWCCPLMVLLVDTFVQQRVVQQPMDTEYH